MSERPEDPILDISERFTGAVTREVGRVVSTLRWLILLLVLVLAAVIAGMGRLSRSAQVVEVQQGAIERNRVAIESTRVDRLVREQQFKILKQEIRDVGARVAARRK